MPSPVPSSNSSYYDPSAQFTPADGDGDGGTSSAASVAASNAPAAPPEVSIPPVVIAGDAGVRQLMQNYDAALERPDCSLEGATAALSCGKGVWWRVWILSAVLPSSERAWDGYDIRGGVECGKRSAGTMIARPMSAVAKPTLRHERLAVLAITIAAIAGIAAGFFLHRQNRTDYFGLVNLPASGRFASSAPPGGKWALDTCSGGDIPSAHARRPQVTMLSALGLGAGAIAVVAALRSHSAWQS